MDAVRDATVEFGWDFAPPNGMFGHDGYEALATKQFRWPGGDLPDNEPFQFVENEYVKADEVDAFLADPNGFTLRTILPRIAGGLEGLGQCRSRRSTGSRTCTTCRAWAVRCSPHRHFARPSRRCSLWPMPRMRATRR